MRLIPVMKTRFQICVLNLSKKPIIFHNEDIKWPFHLNISLLTKHFVFYWEGGGGGAGGICAERDVTQEGSREQTWQSVMVRGRWAKKHNFSAM